MNMFKIGRHTRKRRLASLLTATFLVTWVTYALVHSVRIKHVIVNHGPELNKLPVSKLDFCDDYLCTGETKVIAVSLYGSSLRYTAGAIRNSEIMRDVFPDWQYWVYLANTTNNNQLKVPEDVILRLKQNGARLVYLDATTVANAGFGMNWRFLVADNSSVSRFAIRDSDTRLLLRDRFALDDWEASGCMFHNMRDHPGHSHYTISGGMWGATREAHIPSMLQELSRTSKNQKANYLHDMELLDKVLWPLMKLPGSTLQHDSFTCKKYGNASGFPTRRAGSELVGAVYNEHDEPRQIDIDRLPRQVPQECSSPAWPAASRHIITLHTQSVHCEAFRIQQTVQTPAQEHVPTGVVGYTFKKMFVDAIQSCSSGLNLPTLFNYSHLLYLPHDKYVDCAPPKPGETLQYDERIEWPKTHYQVFKPHGVTYARLLFVSDSFYTNDIRCLLSEGVPVLVLMVKVLPSHGKILFPTQMLFQLREVASAMNLTFSPNMFVEHLLPPYLAWAYRVVVVSSLAPPCASMARSGSNFIDTRTQTMFAQANVALTSALLMLDSQLNVPNQICRAAAMGDAAVHIVQRIKSIQTWVVDKVFDEDSIINHISAIREARVIFVDATMLPLYLAFGQRGALLVFLWPSREQAQAAEKFAHVCAMGVFHCIHAEAPGYNLELLDKLLADITC